MKKIIFVVFLFIITCSCFANELRKSGSCNIQDAKVHEKSKLVIVTLEDSQIKAKCKLYSGKFFKDYALYAVPRVTNICGKEIKVSYHAAFYDSAGKLLACVSQSSELSAGAKNYQLGSSMTKVPESIVKKIKSYKIVIYTSSPKPGK